MSTPRSCRLCGDLHNGQLFHETLCNPCREGASELRGRRILLPTPERALTEPGHYWEGQSVQVTVWTVLGTNDTGVSTFPAKVIQVDARGWVTIESHHGRRTFWPKQVGDRHSALKRITTKESLPA